MRVYGYKDIRGGADKSLARPRRKQATATKVGIDSTYSSRSSIQFLALTIASHSKKNSEACPSNQVSGATMTSASDEKWRPFNCFFSVQIRRIGWVIKTREAQVGQFLLGCKCPVSRGIVVKEKDPLGDLPAPRRFSFKMSFNCTSRDE